MDLKEFIKETMGSIAAATSELQRELADTGVLINPPVSHERDVYNPSRDTNFQRLVEKIEFDAAVTASQETSGAARAGLRVMSLELGASGERAVGSESISRVKFSIPITLPPTQEERENLQRFEERTDRIRPSTPPRY